ncbi:HNH endonuclease [Variovorax sp. TBS-050B]|uniref:HNH endonuclease signature motif containing protein n=1 Tax=Variovorax sp. TBS-050B TaxID=2940551 RepID=UPI0024758A4B|nr:HNH endonuclease [Variovorax sp. TBS-050B]
MPSFNGNGTPGRLLSCQVPRPAEKLRKPDGICDELLNRLRQENEREHGWFYRTFIQGHGRPVGSGETPEINSALMFQRECRALPGEIDKAILDDMRQRAQGGLPPEQSVKLKNDLNILQRVYQPGQYPDLALSSAEQAWVDEKNLYATNTMGMALLGPFGIPGLLTRMGGGSESQVAAANDAGAMAFDMATAGAVKGTGKGAGAPIRQANRSAPREPVGPETEGTVVRRPPRRRPRKLREPRTYERKVVNPDGSTTYTLKTKSGETFDVTFRDGYPDLTPYRYQGDAGKWQVPIEVTGNNATDFPAANRAAGFGQGAYSHPAGYTWHHDAISNQMQLIRTDIHSATPHTGTASAARNAGSP